MRKVLFAALVPGNDGSQRVRVQLGRGIRLGQLPIQTYWHGVAEAAERRSGCYAARAIVGVNHLVDALGAGRDPLCCGSGGLGVAPQDGARLICAGGQPDRKGRCTAPLANYGSPGQFIGWSNPPQDFPPRQMRSRRL